MFDITDIATLSGCTNDEVRTYLPSILNTIRSYTNRSFITPVGVTDDIVVSEYNTITLSGETFDYFAVGDTIELRYSMNNLFIYTVKEISVDLMVITTNEKLYAESFEGIVIKLAFPITNDGIAEMVKFRKTSSSRIGLKTETLDGYSYTLDDVTSYGYPKSILTPLNYLRQLPNSMEREYRVAGYNLQSLR